ncbi:DUF659 domain-containing protein [Abeliophyllum distichum]|uniref:DUF659 domain-containing protein n=1 Tax=Abeliophyllum distichum TaxID=126358 RepID=A0ABD1QVJ4_9LAMI
MKYHLVGIKGQISQCKKVPFDVRFKFQQILKDIFPNKKDAKEAHEQTFEDNSIDLEILGEETEEEIQDINKSLENQRQQKGKRKASEGIETYFAPRTTPRSQPSLNSVLAGKQAVKRAHVAWARWFYDAGILFNALQSPYFQLALDATTAIGPGLKKRSYNPVDYEIIDKTNFWIEEEVPPHNFEYKELENAIYEENAVPNVNEYENENNDQLDTLETGDLDTLDVIRHFGGSNDLGGDQGLRLTDENDEDEI